jgi:type 1 glutamine amidotransferase
MRNLVICAATLGLAVVFGACSDGSAQVAGTAGTTGTVVPMGGSGVVGPTAGTSPIPTAGSMSTGGSGSMPGAGTGSTDGGTAAGGTGPTGGTATGGTATGGTGPVGGTGPTGGTSGGLESGPFKVLILSTTLEFHHDSIPECQQLVADLGKLDAANTWTTQIEGDNLADFTAEGLKPFRLIFSCNPTGVVFSGNSKVADKAGAMKAFTDYVTNGGAFAGVHSATDFEKTNGFPWAINTLLGAYFDHHDNDGTQGSVTLDANAGAHPVLKGISSNYSTQDEWYYMNRDVSAQPGFKILQRLAKDNRPVSWVKDVGTGRMFYTIRGHAKSVYAEKEFKTLVQNAIMWVTKRTN